MYTVPHTLKTPLLGLCKFLLWESKFLKAVGSDTHFLSGVIFSLDASIVNLGRVRRSKDLQIA